MRRRKGFLRTEATSIDYHTSREPPGHSDCVVAGDFYASNDCTRRLLVEEFVDTSSVCLHTTHFHVGIRKFKIWRKEAVGWVGIQKHEKDEIEATDA